MLLKCAFFYLNSIHALFFQNTPCIDYFKPFWNPTSATGTYDIWMKMGPFQTQIQHLNSSLNLFIRFFWIFCVLKENLYLYLYSDKWDIFRPNKATIQKFHKVRSLNFSNILCDDRNQSYLDVFEYYKIDSFHISCAIALCFFIIVVLE